MCGVHRVEVKEDKCTARRQGEVVEGKKKRLDGKDGRAGRVGKKVKKTGVESRHKGRDGGKGEKK